MTKRIFLMRCKQWEQMFDAVLDLVFIVDNYLSFVCANLDMADIAVDVLKYASRWLRFS
jgi:hypothetical protein